MEVPYFLQASLLFRNRHREFWNHTGDLEGTRDLESLESLDTGFYSKSAPCTKPVLWVENIIDEVEACLSLD